MRFSTSVAVVACGLNVAVAGRLGDHITSALKNDFSTQNRCGRTGTGLINLFAGARNGYKCSDGECCSSTGFCGSSDAFCLSSGGCQSAYGTCTATAEGQTGGNATSSGEGGVASGGECGAGKGSCATDCCSAAGFCGTGSDFCKAPDCQFNYGPACDANTIPSGTNTSTIARTKAGSVLYGATGIYDCTVKGDMALTFDDGPFIYTDHILDLLKQYNAKATFFVTGINNGKGEIDNASLPWPTLLKRMYDEGHQIASHTWSHADLSNITSAQRKNEMYKLEMAVRNVVGVIPTYMRPPYSSCSDASGCPTDLADLGYHITYFDLDTADYLNDSPTLIQNSKTIFDNALSGKSPTTDEFLVISHDIHNQTSEVLVEYMLKSLTTAGYKPVTVGTCLGDDQANWYRVDGSVTLGAREEADEAGEENGDAEEGADENDDDEGDDENAGDEDEDEDEDEDDENGDVQGNSTLVERRRASKFHA